MAYTKLMNPITVDAQSGDVVFDGFDFTANATVTVENAASITIRNSRIYNLTADAAIEWMKVKGSLPTKISLENNFFAPATVDIATAVSTAVKLANESSFSHNYFKKDAYTDKALTIKDIDQSASVKVSDNVFEEIGNPFQFAVSGETTCVVAVDKNVAKAVHSDGNFMNALIMIRPDATNTTSFKNMTINMSGNTLLNQDPVIAYYEDTDTQLTPEILPQVNVDGEKFIPMIMTKDSVATVDRVAYKTLAEAVAAAIAGENHEVVLYKDVTESITVAPGSEIVITGATKNVTCKGTFNLNGTGSAPIHATFKNLTLTSDGKHTTNDWAIISQNQTANNQIEVSLVVEDCIIKDYASKGMYLTNAKSLTIRNCDFANNAHGEMNKPNTRGDYTVDLNLVAVKDAVVLIENCHFTDECGKKAAIKVTARGGASDAGASDIPAGTTATVSNVTIRNCSFATTSAEADVRIGTDNKTEGEVKNITGNFPVTIEGCTSDVRVCLAYTDKEFIVTIPTGSTGTQENDDEFLIDGEFVAPVKIGETSYYSLQDACAKAVSGNIITLYKDIVCNNEGITDSNVKAIFNIPAGVTLNGNNKKIVTSADTWIGNNTNHIVSIGDGTCKIENLTIEGNAKCKSGVLCYGTGINATFENLTVNNCGNCGLQIVNGATVALTNYHSAGNVWGSVNADKGSGNTTPHVTYNSGEMMEDVEIYTEILDESCVTAPSLTEVIGVGDKLKGFKYYTSDKSRLGVAAVTVEGVTTVYEDMEEAEAAASEAGVEVEIL